MTSDNGTLPVKARTGEEQDVELMYEFYTDLRDEINQSIEFQNQAVIGGGVLIGVAYGLQFSGILDGLAMRNPALKLIIAALPTTTLFTIALWIVEQSRMMRAGHYLHFLENKINAELDGVYLTWENWLRGENTPVYHHVHKRAQLVGYVFFLYGLALLGFAVYAVELLDVTVASLGTLSFRWDSLAFVYFLLNVGLLGYLSQYTYLIVSHDRDDSGSTFEDFKEWETGYFRNHVSGFPYQGEIAHRIGEHGGTGEPKGGDDGER